MAVCRVIKSGEGWNVGDRVEAFDDRLAQLVESGSVVVEVPDEPVEEVKVEPVEVVTPKRGRPKKGVK